MKNVSEIFDMLDWNNDDEVQQQGICYARQLDDISLFLQPRSTLHNKNVWENCAKILAEKSDHELEPFLPQLLKWIKDLNWPGAQEILERLERFEGCEAYIEAVESSVNTALANEKLAWLSNLAELLSNEHLRSNLSSSVTFILEQYKGFIWD